MSNIIQAFPKGNGTDMSIIAEEFDDTKDYKVGDKCIYEKKYYVFINNHNAGAWDSSDVDETNVSEEIPIGLTDEDMDEIKAQFHPRQIGNVSFCHLTEDKEHGIIYYNNSPLIICRGLSIYINSETGVDDINSGYGFSAEKPFATIEYALSFTSNISAKIIGFYIQGTFSSPTLKEMTLRFPGTRINIYVTGETVLNNYTFMINACAAIFVTCSANVTINITDTTLTAAKYAIRCNSSIVNLFQNGASTQNPILFTINGNVTTKQYINGIVAETGGYLTSNSTAIKTVVNNCNTAVISNCANISVMLFDGTGNTTGLEANAGTIMCRASTLSATTATKKQNGGQIYIGS